MFGFINVTFIDILDIVLVAMMIFEMFRILRGTSAASIFTAVFSIYCVWLLARALDMGLLSFILGQVLGVGVIALIVIFQPEIRRFLLKVGSRYKNFNFFSKHLSDSSASGGASVKMLEEMTNACQNMAATKTGALIVLSKAISLDQYIETGDVIDSAINSRLIENIFFKNTPLHDGAMIMNANRIISARCTLPISDNAEIPPSFGMRHRAGIGITEVTDAACIVVSEETGGITFIIGGVWRKVNSNTELRLSIEEFYK